MKTKNYFLGSIFTLAFGQSIFAQIPTTGLIFEHRFNTNYSATIPAAAENVGELSGGYSLGEDANGQAQSALNCYETEGIARLTYNNLTNDLQTVNTNGQGITYYCNAKFDSLALEYWSLSSYHTLVSNGKNFIRIRKDKMDNQDPFSYAVQFGIFDANDSEGTYGWNIVQFGVSHADLRNWMGYGLVYNETATGSQITGYFGDFRMNSVELTSPTIDLTFAPEDSLLFIGGTQSMTFNGLIDNVLIYENALSASDIYSLNTIFNTATISENSQLANLSVYPNPAKEKLFIKSSIDEIEYELFSAAGEKLMSGEYNSAINIENLKSGIYFVKVMSAGAKEVVKFVKE